MSFTKLWETPQESINGCSRIKLHYYENEVVILLEYKKNNLDSFVKLCFQGVVLFRHLGGMFASKKELNAYECLIEHNESDLLKDLESRNKEEYSFWKPKHFSIYTEDDRLFDIIAENYTIEE